MPLADRPPLRCGLSAVQSFQAHRTIPSLSISNVRPADRPLPRAGPSAGQNFAHDRNIKVSGPTTKELADRPPQWAGPSATSHTEPIKVRLHRLVQKWPGWSNRRPKYRRSGQTVKGRTVRSPWADRPPFTIFQSTRNIMFLSIPKFCTADRQPRASQHYFETLSATLATKSIPHACNAIVWAKWHYRTIKHVFTNPSW